MQVITELALEVILQASDNLFAIEMVPKLLYIKYVGFYYKYFPLYYSILC